MGSRRIELSCGHAVPASLAVVSDLKHRGRTRCQRCGRLVITAEQVRALAAERSMAERRETIIHGPVHGPELPTAPDGNVRVTITGNVQCQTTYGDPWAGARAVAPLMAARVAQ